MKKIIIATTLILLSISLFGQAQESHTPQFKKQVKSAVIFLPYSPEVVIKALGNFISRKGKSEEKKAVGFQLFENTILYKNNIYDFDMHFFCGFNNIDNPNESVLYLNLESSSQNNYDVSEVNQFNMQQAKDYLDNLVIAIKYYATDLQLALQNKNLVNSMAKGQDLVNKSIQLNKKRANLEKIAFLNASFPERDRYIKRLTKNKQKIDDNVIAQTDQNNEITKQKIALALLVNTAKA